LTEGFLRLRKYGGEEEVYGVDRKKLFEVKRRRW
jgi:hypothetical protein